MFRPEKFTRKTACILGAGKSGIEAAKMLARRGFSVLISDEKKITKLPALPAGIEVESGGHSERVFACEFIIKSPGIFPKAPVLKQARNSRIFRTGSGACFYAQRYLRAGGNRHEWKNYHYYTAWGNCGRAQ